MSWVEEFFDGPFYARDYQATQEDSVRTTQEVAFIIRQLALGSEDHVLDLACGAGRHALLVAGHVHKVTGTDRTEQFIEQAWTAADEGGAENTVFIKADMRELDDVQEFDAAYNYFTAWGYYDDETNFDVLRRIHRAIKPGGRFLLEILNRDNIVRRFQANDWSRREDGAVNLYERRFDLATGRMHSTYTYLTDGKEHTVEIDHYLPTADALIRHFRDAGFKDVRVVGAPDGSEVALETRRIAVIGTA